MTFPAADRITVFRPRSAGWFTGALWTVVGVGTAASVSAYGADGLRESLPLLAVGYFGWWLAWYPAVVIGSDAVLLRNPVLTVAVPWAALAAVDTKYALTLVTPRRKFTAWAAPAPGMFGVHRARAEDLKGLPETTYGPAQSVRPGDLGHSDSGAAAYHVRKRWAERQAGGIGLDRADPVQVVRTPNWNVVAAGILLVALSALSAAL